MFLGYLHKQTVRITSKCKLSIAILGTMTPNRASSKLACLLCKKSYCMSYENPNQ